MKKETITTLIIVNNGDYDVGLNGFNFEIEVKEQGNFLDGEIKDEFISFMKEKLKEFCSNHDAITHVYTQEEIEDIIDVDF